MRKNTPLVFRAAIAVAYVAIGIFVWNYKFFVVKLSETAAFALGLVLIIYGLFRAYVAWSAFKNQQ